MSKQHHDELDPNGVNILAHVGISKSELDAELPTLDIEKLRDAALKAGAGAALLLSGKALGASTAAPSGSATLAVTTSTSTAASAGIVGASSTVAAKIGAASLTTKIVVTGALAGGVGMVGISMAPSVAEEEPLQEVTISVDAQHVAQPSLSPSLGDAEQNTEQLSALPRGVEREDEREVKREEASEANFESATQKVSGRHKGRSKQSKTGPSKVVTTSLSNEVAPSAEASDAINENTLKGDTTQNKVSTPKNEVGLTPESPKAQDIQDELKLYRSANAAQKSGAYQLARARFGQLLYTFGEKGHMLDEARLGYIECCVEDRICGDKARKRSRRYHDEIQNPQLKRRAGTLLEGLFK